MIVPAPLIMATIALVSAVAAAIVLLRPVHSEAGSYGKRIAGTMLAAFAIILGGFAASLWSWSVR
jgi:hypothetical protein